MRDLSKEDIQLAHKKRCSALLAIWCVQTKQLWDNFSLYFVDVIKVHDQLALRAYLDTAG